MAEDVVDNTVSEAAPEPAPLVLRILSGLHDGASRALGEQEMLLIGSGEDCDIILSDPGVARHHAMVLRHGDTLSLRAIDAAMEFAGDPLEPGDPIDLPLLEPARLGGVSIAIGPADASGWTALGATPGAVATTPPPTAAASRPLLPTALAAVALLSLVSVGIYAMVRPGDEPSATPEERIEAMAGEYGVRDSELFEGSGKTLVLAGTVEDPATAERLRERVGEEGLPVELRLRTGEDVANDVREVLRTFGISATTRYQGNGAVRVEPMGGFDDWALLAEAGSSRVMRDVSGFTELLPPRDAPLPTQHPAAARERREPIRMIAVVTGDDPHVLASTGVQYRPGEILPDGRGRLSGISEKGALTMVDGEVRKLKIEPAPAAADASAGAPDDALAAQMDGATGEAADTPEDSTPAAATATDAAATPH